MQLHSKWPILFLIWAMMLIAYFDRIDMAVAGPDVMAALHISKSQFGWVLSAFTFGYAAMQVPGGHCADKFGSRPLLVAAILAWSLFTIFTGLAGSLLALIAIRILFGFGEGIEIGPQFKLIGDYFTTQERSRANSFFLSALALGPAIATPVATWLIGSYGWRAMFFAFAVPGFLMAGALFFLLPRKPPLRPESADSESFTGSRLGDSLRHPPAWFCAAAYFFFNATFWGFLSWVPTYLTSQRHLTLAKMGFAGSLPYLCGFVGMVVIGHLGSTKLADRRAILAGGCALLSGALLYLAMSASEAAACVAWLSAAAFFIFGVFGPFWAMVVGLAAPAARGAFTGFVNFFGQSGAFCGQIAIGYLADKMGSFDGAILFMSATIWISAAVLLSFAALRRPISEAA